MNAQTISKVRDLQVGDKILFGCFYLELEEILHNATTQQYTLLIEGRKIVCFGTDSLNVEG